MKRTGGMMYDTVVVENPAGNAVEQQNSIEQTAVCFAFAGVSKSTGNRMWLCGESKGELEKIAFLLRISKLSKNSDLVLLDNLMNHDESVFLVSPSDGIGAAERLPDGSLMVESRGKHFKVPGDNESFCGVFEGL